MIEPNRNRFRMSPSSFLIILATSGFLSACATTPITPVPLPKANATGATLAIVAQAQNIDLYDPLSPDALAAIVVFTNPELQALRTREGVAEAQVFASGLYPDPTFSIGLDVPVNGTGLVPALGAGIGYDLGALAKRPHVLRRAHANLNKVRHDIAWAEWLTGQQARLLAVRISHLRQLKALTAQIRIYADRDLARVQQAVLRGDLSTVSMETRRLAAIDAADRDRNTELQLRTAELDLNRLLGIYPGEALSLAPPVARKLTLPANDVLYAKAIAARADLAGLRAGYEGASADVDVARLGAYPLPSLGLNPARDTSGIATFGPNISFTLPIWNRGRGDIAVAKASQAQLRAEYSARLEAISADIAAARAALEITHRQRVDVAHELVPLILQVSALDEATVRGDLSQSSAAAAHLTVLAKQIIEAGLALAEAEYEIALEVSMGQSLETIR